MARVRRTACACPECSRWCEHVPGWFKPHEIKRAAAHLGLTVQEFFDRHLTVDYWAGDDGLFVLRPRTVEEPGGTESPYDPRGTCAFYRDGKCAIHPVKPHECATAKHDVTLPDDWHHQTALAWADAQTTIAQLLGHEPEQPEPNMMDVFSLMFLGGR